MSKFNEIAFVDVLRSKIQRVKDNFDRTDITTMTHLDNAKKFIQDISDELDMVQGIEPCMFVTKEEQDEIRSDFDEIHEGAGYNDYTSVDAYGYLGRYYVAWKVGEVDAYEVDMIPVLCKTEVEAKHLFRDSLIAAFRDYLKDDDNLKWEFEKVIVENGFDHAEEVTPDQIRLFLAYGISKREAKK